jgi:hypothetical protein
MLVLSTLRKPNEWLRFCEYDTGSSAIKSLRKIERNPKEFPGARQISKA